MLQQRIQLTSAAMAAALLFLVGCDTNDGPIGTTDEDRTITQSPETDQPDVTRPDTTETDQPDVTRPDTRDDDIGRTDANGIDIEESPDTQDQTQQPQDSPQQQEGIDQQQDGIEVEPEQ